MSVPPGGWAAAMRAAIAEGRLALEHGDVPVGALVLDEAGEVVGRGHNERELTGDPLAHAELVAMRAAARTRGGWRFDGCTLVVTLEPCPMCAGAIGQARLGRLVFGAFDAKAGAVASLFDVLRDPRLPYRVDVVGGILADDCAAELRAFFAARR